MCFEYISLNIITKELKIDAMVSFGCSILRRLVRASPMLLAARRFLDDAKNAVALSCMNLALVIIAEQPGGKV